MVALRLARLARQGRAFAAARVAIAQPQASETALSRWARGRNASRAFSSKGLNGVNGEHYDDDEWEDDAPLNGDVSPFERLLQHSQQFRDGVDLQELSEDLEDGEELPVTEDDESKHDDDDLEAVLEELKNDHDEVVGQIHKPHGHHQHRSSNANKHERPHTRGNRFPKHWGIEQRVRRQIGKAEEVDFEHGLRDLDERRAREKMYLQLLARDYDRDRVCQNCGEPGHVARNCMLPTICSNCGDVGHRRSECPHRSYSIDQLASTKPVHKGGRKKSAAQLEAETRRRVELQAIRERHDRMKKAFDEELDEYLDFYDNEKKKREEKASNASGKEE